MNYGRNGRPAAIIPVAPLRCDACGTPIQKKPKAKTPKYCPPCRHAKQAEFKQNRRNLRRH